MPYYLYGHYDSRGGAQLIQADTREQADHAYLASFGYFSAAGMLAEEWNTPEHRAEVIEEEFLHEVTLEAHRAISQNEDLEYGPSEGFTTNDDNNRELARAFEDGLAWAGEDIANITPNPFAEILWWHEEHKILRLCAPGVNPRFPDRKNLAAVASYSVWPARAEQVEDGWVRSHFGEDACGVVYNTAQAIEEEMK